MTTADPLLVRKLLDGFQRGFPLAERPYAAIGEEIGAPEDEVVGAVAQLLGDGVLSRVGAVIEPGSAGASTLAAMEVPSGDLEAVADLVGSFPDVNHSYERDHPLNLWFVVTSPDSERLAEVLGEIRARTGLEVLDLPMEEPYHLDLGFALDWPEDEMLRDRESAAVVAVDLDDGDSDVSNHGNGNGHVNGNGDSFSDRTLDHTELQVLAALQDGLPAEPRPFAAIGARAGMPEDAVLETVAGLIAGGVIRRLGLVVRHHELGYRHNAMVVFDVPDGQVSDLGRSVAASGLATLCYRRERRAPQWPYNLYLMVHARSRSEALDAIERLREQCSLSSFPHEVLFSTRRFKQQGARYFADSAGARRDVHA